MKLKRVPKVQMIRHLIQLAVFIFFPALFITTLSAMREIVTALVEGTFSFSDLSALLITVIGVLIITALWGRFFCGFLCSFGALQDLVAFPCKKLRRKKKLITERTDRLLKFLKYVILSFNVVLIWILVLPVDSSLDPWGVFGMVVSGNLSVTSAAILTVGFDLLMAILIASFFVERFFCRYLCPLGAVFALASGKRLYKIRRSKETCINCGLCTKKCSMGIDVASKDAVTSGECIDCMKCIDVCPCNSLSAVPAPAVAGTAAAVVMCGLVTVGRITVPSTTDPGSNISDEDQGSAYVDGIYIDGVYTGSAKGYNGFIEVQVVIKDGNISEVTILSHSDDEEFFRIARKNTINAILANQTVNVDTATRATISSRGIIKAVADALGVTYEKPKKTDSGK